MAQTFFYRLSDARTGRLRYFRRVGSSAMPVLNTFRNATTSGDVEISKDEYESGGLTCTGTGEISTPVTPTTPAATISNLTYEWNNLSTPHAFKGGFSVSDDAEYVAFLEARDGQALPTPYYLDAVRVSEVIAGKAVNRAFLHGPKSEGFHGVLPGRYYFRVKKKFDQTVSATEEITLTAGTNTGATPGDVINLITGEFRTGVGRIALANVTAPVQIKRDVRYANGQTSSTGWQTPTLIGGAYGAGGATVEFVFGATPDGHYTETWRPANSENVTLHEYLSYSEGSQSAPTYRFGAFTGQRVLPGATRPPGTDSCTNYAKVTATTYETLPIVTVFECPDTTRPGRTRAFATEQEAVSFWANSISAGRPDAGFDRQRCTSAGLEVGATLYGNNFPPDGDFLLWPAEAGYWGYQVPAQGGNAILIQTNACGVIIARKTVFIPTN